MSLAHRKLGRTEVRVPTLIWRLTGPPDPDMLRACTEASTTWAYIPHATPLNTVRAAAMDGWSYVIGVEMEALRTRVVQPLEEKLSSLGARQCAAVMVESPTSMGVKAGWPFHRLSQLRDRGVTSQFWVDTDDVQVAEWIVEQTPAHAVVVGYGHADQAARYRLFNAARDMGVAVIGKPLGREMNLEDVRLCSSEPGLTTQMIDLPNDLPTLNRLLEAMQMDLTGPELDAAWDAYAKAHSEPPRPKGAHPPEFGS